MSSSSSNSQNVVETEAVESFLYQDTGSGQGATGEIVRGEHVAKAKKSDDLPRISEAELSRIVLEARTEGLREGEKNARAALETEINEIRRKAAQLITEFQQEREEYYSKVEGELVRLALSIAAKILHREAQVDPMLVAGIVKVAVEKLQQNTKIIVRVRPEDASSWRASFSQKTNVEISEDPSLQPLDCVLETEAGSAMMGLDAQLKEIEKGFCDLLAQRPGTK